jgi:DNA-binding response OmpR family regulator
MIKNILLVEDERPLRQALNKKLTSSGFRVFEAGNGEEGLSILTREKIDLILLDIILPVMDGVGMLKEMRKNRKYDKIKIIILTNLTEYSSDHEVLKPHQKNYLIKSNYSLNDIVKKIKKINKEDPV